MRLEMDYGQRRLINVVGKIVGSTAPDEWIVVGSHRDAWTFGASDSVSGHVSMMMLSILPVIGQIQAGMLNALAVASPERSSLIPNVPTIAEAGLPGMEAENWFVLGKILVRLRATGVEQCHPEPRFGEALTCPTP